MFGIGNVRTNSNKIGFILMGIHEVLVVVQGELKPIFGESGSKFPWMCREMRDMSYTVKQDFSYLFTLTLTSEKCDPYNSSI